MHYCRLLIKHIAYCENTTLYCVKNAFKRVSRLHKQEFHCMCLYISDDVIVLFVLATLFDRATCYLSVMLRLIFNFSALVFLFAFKGMNKVIFSGVSLVQPGPPAKPVSEHVVRREVCT